MEGGRESELRCNAKTAYCVHWLEDTVIFSWIIIITYHLQGDRKKLLRRIPILNVCAFQDRTLCLHPNVPVPFAFTSLKILIKKHLCSELQQWQRIHWWEDCFVMSFSVLHLGGGEENILEMSGIASYSANKHCPLLEKWPISKAAFSNSFTPKEHNTKILNKVHL